MDEGNQMVTHEIGSVVRFGAEVGGIVVEALPAGRYRVRWPSGHFGTYMGKSIKPYAPPAPDSYMMPTFAR